jgi:hypothetical protein
VGGQCRERLWSSKKPRKLRPVRTLTMAFGWHLAPSLWHIYGSSRYLSSQGDSV